MSTALLPLHEAAKLFPQNNGKHPHVITIRRWILAGSRGVKLTGERVGGQWYTSAAYVAAFIAAGTERAMRDHGAIEGRGRVVSKEHDAAVESLRRFGIYVDGNEQDTNGEAATIVPHQ